MFFRIIAGVMFSVAGAVAGISFSERLKNELELCRNIHEMLMNVAVIVRCRAEDVYAVSAELKQNKQLCRLTFLQEIPDKYSPEEDFREIWTNSVNSQKNLPEDAKKLLCDFGAVFGQSDIEGQLVSIETLGKNAEILTKKYYELYSEKGKLYRSVGMLFGVMVGILII
ncbi:MAG: stage III sporulation protein AB [Ruminococcus flavefaciens]|nr:stage III sporulation protein AB [Ruminococcus flavefaciens]